jgi:hypothetical protein
LPALDKELLVSVWLGILELATVVFPEDLFLGKLIYAPVGS